MTINKRGVLLIYPRTNPYPHTVSTPLSIFALGSYLERRGIDVDYFDERVQPLGLLKELLGKKPVLAGVSCMTGYQVQRAVSISRHIRERHGEMPICWGGTHPSMLPEHTLQSAYIDFIIRGEGEEGMYELYKELTAEKRGLSSIKGLCWKDGPKVIKNEDRPFLDANTLPSPYESEKVKALSKKFFMSKKNRGRFTFGYEIARGCRNNCAFCYEPQAHKKTMRQRSRELYKKDLLELKALGVASIFFYDNHISINNEFLREFCEVMKELDMEWGGGFRVNYLRNEDDVAMLEQSKCRSLFFGIESVEDDILKALNKGQDLKLINNAIDLMSKSTIRPTYSFMFAFPFEKDVDIGRLLDFVDGIIKKNPKAEIAIQPYTPLPGTALFERALEMGFKLPEKIEDYREYTTGDMIGPWVRDRSSVLNIFLVSFLLFRAKYYLDSLIYAPLIKLAEIRWRNRYFKIPAERAMYMSLKRMYLLADEVRARIQWYL